MSAGKTTQNQSMKTRQNYDTEGSIVHVKPENVHANFAGDVETMIDTSNYEVDRPLPTGKNKKLIGLMD